MFVTLYYSKSTTSNPTATTGFSQTYNISSLQFIPDKMIVRNITIYTTGASGSYIIQSDLSDWYTIASFNDGTNNTSVVNSKFEINKEIKGTYNFKIYGMDTNNNGAIIPANLTAQIVIQLEFIKY